MGWDEVLSARQDQWGLNLYIKFELAIVVNDLATAYSYFTVVVSRRARGDEHVLVITTDVFDRSEHL